MGLKALLVNNKQTDEFWYLTGLSLRWISFPKQLTRRLREQGYTELEAGG